MKWCLGECAELEIWQLRDRYNILVSRKTDLGGKF